MIVSEEELEDVVVADENDVLVRCRRDNSSQYKPSMESGLETQRMP